jgi:hypothetical protein
MKTQSAWFLFPSVVGLSLAIFHCGGDDTGGLVGGGGENTSGAGGSGLGGSAGTNGTAGAGTAGKGGTTGTGGSGTTGTGGSGTAGRGGGTTGTGGAAIYDAGGSCPASVPAGSCISTGQVCYYVTSYCYCDRDVLGDAGNRWYCQGGDSGLTADCPAQKPVDGTPCPTMNLTYCHYPPTSVCVCNGRGGGSNKNNWTCY